MTAKILGISFVLALGAAFLVRYILIAGMSNVHKASKADAYLDEESFSLVDSNDTFLYTHTHRSSASQKPRKNRDVRD